MTEREIRRAVDLARTARRELEEGTWVGDPDDVIDIVNGFLATVDLMGQVVREWDEDGHSPTNGTFKQAAKVVGFPT